MTDFLHHTFAVPLVPPIGNRSEDLSLVNFPSVYFLRIRWHTQGYPSPCRLNSKCIYYIILQTYTIWLSVFNIYHRICSAFNYLNGISLKGISMQYLQNILNQTVFKKWSENNKSIAGGSTALTPFVCLSPLTTQASPNCLSSCPLECTSSWLDKQGIIHAMLSPEIHR